MLEIITFLLASVLITWYSIPSLKQPRSHGFFRFFAWEIILGLILLNLHGWFAEPFAWHQIVSWTLLVSSLYLVVDGVLLLRHAGKPQGSLEATTRLVREGIYRYIRHPLYASLLYLAWGIFFKSPSLLDGCLAIIAAAFLYATGRADEAECVERFGKEYTEYKKQTRMFIPFIF
jgi:protein-S-isoprenylcysteine O-methyltransferase Ste14